MHILAGIFGAFLIFAILWDGFETIILPRRVTRSFRLTRLFYHTTWKFYALLARRVRNLSQREGFISYFGPLSLILLLICWAASLIIGFALLQWGLGSQVDMTPNTRPFMGDLYLSLSSFVTLGLSGITPRTSTARLVTLLEGGVGYGFLALVISYLPALTSAFSRREVNVSMLDERAGSPPTAFGLLVRSNTGDGLASINQFLFEWEHWTAELMESHLSYPVLAYFRSQHDNQSWVAALAMVLDLSALVLSGIEDPFTEPARLTFAIARHAVVDLTQIFNTPPLPPKPDRLPPAELDRLRAGLQDAGVQLRNNPRSERRLAELRMMYEPYLNALADYLIVDLPPWITNSERRDNWETTAWE